MASHSFWILEQFLVLFSVLGSGATIGWDPENVNTFFLVLVFSKYEKHILGFTQTCQGQATNVFCNNVFCWIPNKRAYAIFDRHIYSCIRNWFHLYVRCICWLYSDGALLGKSTSKYPYLINLTRLLFPSRGLHLLLCSE